MQNCNMDFIIHPSNLHGTVTPPPSKSQAHRAILAQALSSNPGRIDNLSPSQDIEATLRCVDALRTQAHSLPLLDCGESGSTLRFLIPVALALCHGARFTGHGRLMERPQKPYFDIFDEKGILFRFEDGVLTIRGALPAGTYRLPGNVSSQFVTGLLYALPLIAGDSEILMTSALESRDYVIMTLDMLEKFNIQVENHNYSRFSIPGGQRYCSRDLRIEADWSQAAFWYAARALGHSLEVDGMNPVSAQGDRVIEAQYQMLSRPGECTIDVSGCPDLVPPLAAIASFRQSTTHLTNAARLRLKESDRLSAVREELCKLGVPVDETPDSLTIHGIQRLQSTQLDSHNDHRIAMMAAILATRASGPVTLRGAESVAKSYPSFWDDYKCLGGKFEEVTG